MTAPETWLTHDELLVTDEGFKATDLGPGVPARQLPHGLSAIYIPRGLTRAEENQLRAALGVPPRPAKRKTT
jgi:hypothetical protein